MISDDEGKEMWVWLVVIDKSILPINDRESRLANESQDDDEKADRGRGLSSGGGGRGGGR